MNQIIDQDGIANRTIEIGKQEWMAENLNVSHYKNGDPIPQVEDKEEWTNLKTGAWCYYENSSKHGIIYGKLYNWYAINDSRGLSPEGWNIPSNVDWQQMIDYLGGEGVAGGKMKEKGTAHWISPNEGANNISGFNGLPGGARHSNGTCVYKGETGYFWSSSEAGNNKANYYILWNDDKNISQGKFNFEFGFSIRCIKN